MCFIGGGTHISNRMYSSTPKLHIPSQMGFPYLGTHIPSDMYSNTQETNINSDMCSSTWETHYYPKCCVTPRPLAWWGASSSCASLRLPKIAFSTHFYQAG